VRRQHPYKKKIFHLSSCEDGEKENDNKRRKYGNFRLAERIFVRINTNNLPISRKGSALCLTAIKR
jgi:hypothetical protein